MNNDTVRKAVILAMEVCTIKDAKEAAATLALVNTLVASAICRNAPSGTLPAQVKATLDAIHASGYARVNNTGFGKTASQFIQVIEEGIKNDQQAKH